MEYLHTKTLELLIYLLCNECFRDYDPYRLYKKTFAAKMKNEIRTDLIKNGIKKSIGENWGSAECYKKDGTVETVDTIQVLTAYNHQLKPFIKKYVNAFKENKLAYEEKKYYSFDEHIQLFSKLILEPIQKENRKSFTLNYNFDEIDFSLAREILQKDFELKKFRLYELLLYLNDKKYIKINKKMKFIELKNALALAGEFKKEEYILSINISLNREPTVISKILLSEISPDSYKQKRRCLKFSDNPEEVINSKYVDIYLGKKAIKLWFREYIIVYKIAVNQLPFNSTIGKHQTIISRINKKVQDGLLEPKFNFLTEDKKLKKYILNKYINFNRAKYL